MQIVEKALRELKKVMYLLDLSNILLNAFIVFLSVLLLATIFEFDWKTSLVLSIAYLLIASVKAFLTNKFALVESRVPELNEQITTVADNVSKSNPILDSLKQDVVRNMHKVKTSYFIDFNTVAARLILLCGLSFLIVLLSFVNVKFDFAGFSDFASGLGIGGFRDSSTNLTDIELQLLEGNLSSILGNKSLAELGSRELSLRINPLESDVDLNKVRKEGESGFTPPSFPKEIYTSYDAAYSENIAKENQKVVKSYFEEITK